MRAIKLLTAALLGIAAFVGAPFLAGAETSPGCPLIPIPEAIALADPDQGRIPAPPPPPTRITTVQRTSVTVPEDFRASYCLYSPPSGAPKGLLLYNHGFQFGEMGSLDAMLQFLANSGYYVVYPYIRFQIGIEGSFTEYKQFPRLALVALRHALTSLQQQNVTIQHVAVAGHSLGGIAAVRVAAMWAQEGRLPPIRAIVLHDPAGKTFLAAFNKQLVLNPFDLFCSCNWPPGVPELDAFKRPPLEGFALDKQAGEGLWGLTASDLAPIPCETYLLIIQAQTTAEEPIQSFGDRNSAAETIWQNLPQISRYVGSPGKIVRFRRNFLRVRHDVSHVVSPEGRGVRVSDHAGVAAGASYPGAPREPLTSLDYYGYWLPLRGALEVAAGRPHNVNKQIHNPYCNTSGSSGTCAMTRFMGTWADGGKATTMQNAEDLDLFSNLSAPAYCASQPSTQTPKPPP